MIEANGKRSKYGNVLNGIIGIHFVLRYTFENLTHTHTNILIEKDRKREREQERERVRDLMNGLQCNTLYL